MKWVFDRNGRFTEIDLENCENVGDENWYYLIIAKSSFLSCRIPFRNENECRDENTDQKQPTKNCEKPSFHGKRRVNVHGIVQMV